LGKLAFFLMIGVLVYWLIKIRLSEKAKHHEDDTNEESNASKSLEEMVRCAHCGVHLPRSESITSHGEFFCSDEHRSAYLNSSS